jgi:hypothetical protein
MKFAPIVVFAYNRPRHIKRALRSLKRNPEIDESPVYIYCDGARNPKDRRLVDKTRDVVIKEAPKHAEIILRGQNQGLANSISYGVTQACEKHGRVIIIEDDLVLSPGALSYFNRALDRYADDDKAMHVSGYMFPSDIQLPDAFFYREATCWGWATWKRAWEHYNPNSAELVKAIEKKEAVADFNLNNSMFFMQMLRKQALGEIDSWAIRWYASMYLRGGLSLHPAVSLVANEGFDGTGVHCSITDQYKIELAESFDGEWPEKVEESMAAIFSTMDFRGNRFLPNKKSWPVLPKGVDLPFRRSTGRPVDVSVPPQ